jgi:hypothetical protein
VLGRSLAGRLLDPVSGLVLDEWSGRGAFGGSQADAMRDALSQQIAEADVLACMVGPEAHTDRWVRWELETGVDHGRGIVAIRLRPGTRDFMPAPVLHAGAPVVDAHPQSVIAAIERIAFMWRSQPGNK